ncbi:MAG: manganese efflux pump MntP [Chloroflexota bacterium]
MDLLSVFAIALGLAMDAFSVAVATGMALVTVGAGQSLRMSVSFGFFQFVMPLAGWLVGVAVAGSVSAYDHWVAFALLAYVGGKMIWESLRGGSEAMKGDPTRGATLLVLSLATSIDALAVGLGFALLREPVLLPAAIIGVVALLMTMLGLQLGRSLGSLIGSWMERLGGLVLIAIGIKIVIEHSLS